MTFLWRRQFLRQPPGITLLLQSMHDIIGNSVSFFFRQFLPKAANKFARAFQFSVPSYGQESLT
jgi:hypothetical protein